MIRYRFVQVRSNETFQRIEGFEVQVACLLSALQRAQARPPTEPEAEEVLQRWSRAKPANTPSSNTVVIFTKESLAKPSLFSFWKGNARYWKKKGKKQDYAPYEESSLNFLLLLKRHENQCWERCQFAPFSPETGKGTKISAERDAKSQVSPRKLEKFRLDRYRVVDRYSESKLEPLTAVWPSTIAVHGPIKVFWTAYRAMDCYRVPQVWGGKMPIPLNGIRTCTSDTRPPYFRLHHEGRHASSQSKQTLQTLTHQLQRETIKQRNTPTPICGTATSGICKDLRWVGVCVCSRIE